MKLSFLDERIYNYVFILFREKQCADKIVCYIKYGNSQL